MKILIMMFALFIASSSWAQDEMYGDYPEDTDSFEGEFNQGRLPQSDFEDIPREEQEYNPVYDDLAPEEQVPEEVYEADEEYLE